MSVRVMSAVWELDLPDSDKLVLLALADCANDEGHCWPSMATLAKKCSKSDRTIQAAIKSLCDAGHLTRIEVRGKGCNYTVHPARPSRQMQTPGTLSKTGHRDTPEAASPRSGFPPKRLRETPEAASDKPSRTIKLPKKDKPSLVAHELPDEWEPSEFGVATQSRKVIDGWPPGELECQLEQFRAHHRKKGDRFKSWQDAWSTWVLNSRKFGAGNGRPHGLGRYQSPDGLSSTARAGLDVFGAGNLRSVSQ